MERRRWRWDAQGVEIAERALTLVDPGREPRLELAARDLPIWFLDGIATRTSWVPLDVAGELDFSPRVISVFMTLAKGLCSAQALARPEGLVVLAGSQPATSTAPALEDNYKAQRARLRLMARLRYVTTGSRSSGTSSLVRHQQRRA